MPEQARTLFDSKIKPPDYLAGKGGVEGSGLGLHVRVLRVMHKFSSGKCIGLS